MPGPSNNVGPLHLQVQLAFTVRMWCLLDPSELLDQGFWELQFDVREAFPNEPAL